LFQFIAEMSDESLVGNGDFEYSDGHLTDPYDTVEQLSEELPIYPSGRGTARGYQLEQTFNSNNDFLAWVKAGGTWS
jgi:hypothetical protein